MKSGPYTQFPGDATVTRSYPDEMRNLSTNLLESKIMTRKRLFVLAVLFAGSGLFLLSRSIQKSVTLSINGETEEIITSTWTVSDFLNENEIILNDEDFIDPALSAWLFGGENITIETASWISIHADGEITQLINLQREPSKLLSQAEITLFPGDQLIIDGEPGQIDDVLLPGQNHTIQVLRSQAIELSFDGKKIPLSSRAGTLGQALWENGIQLRRGDHLSPSADIILDDPTEASLSTARDIQIKFVGGRIKSRSAETNVGDALLEAGIPLQGMDFSVPAPADNIPNDGEIQVVRVKEDLILENEPIPYKTETQLVANLEIDTKEVVQRGVYGLYTQRVRVRFEDEVEVSRQVEAEYISQETEPEIIGYGTKIVPKTLQTPSGPIQYWRALEMYAISYNVTSSGGDGFTATGLPLEKGVVAIDPNYIPYGTRMYIPGYGHALAADTGGGIKGRMIDLGYRDEDYVSWHQWVTVYFLWPPPEFVAWIIP